jgi:peroxiredoxin
VLEAGEQLPDVTLFDLERKPVLLRSLVDDGPILLLFYLFDWSAT